MDRNLEDFSDDELINIVHDYSDNHSSFDRSFVLSLDSYLDEHFELTVNQRDALEKIIKDLWD